MGSATSKEIKILKIRDLLPRFTVELGFASPNGSSEGFLESIRALNLDLIKFKDNYKSVDYILELKATLLERIFTNTKTAIKRLNEIILDLDVILKNKKTKIDKNLSYIFEKFLTESGTLGKNKSETFLGFVVTAKRQALELFMPFLENLHQDPILRLNIDTLRGNSGSLPEMTDTLVKNVSVAIKTIEGAVGVFVRSINDIFKLWDNFFSMPYIVSFDEICSEYKKLNQDAAKLSQKTKEKLGEKAKQYFMNEFIMSAQSAQGTKSKKIDWVELRAKFGATKAKNLIVLAKLYNFHVGFNKAKIDLIAAQPINKQQTAVLSEPYMNLFKLLQNYFKLSDELVQIISYARRGDEVKHGGNDVPYGGVSDYTAEKFLALNAEKKSAVVAQQRSTFLIWAVILCASLIIVIFILLWKNDEMIAKKNVENISVFYDDFKGVTILN